VGGGEGNIELIIGQGGVGTSGARGNNLGDIWGGTRGASIGEGLNGNDEVVCPLIGACLSGWVFLLLSSDCLEVVGGGEIG
jgi:hypothetical protein